MQIAVFKHDALSGLHAVKAGIEDAGDNDIGRISTGVINARIAILAEAQFHFRGSGSADHDAEVGREQDVGVPRNGETGLNRAAIESNLQTGYFVLRRTCIYREANRRRGTDVQHASIWQCDLRRGGAGRDGSTASDVGSSLPCLHRPVH